MNPSKPLMLVALLLARAGGARAADDADWKPVNTATQGYYVGKDDFVNFEAAKKGEFVKPIPLWVGDKEKKRSEAVLKCKPIKGHWIGKHLSPWLPQVDCGIKVNKAGA